MDEFTNEEKNRIDELYATDFKDIKPDDVKLIARFERFMAKQEDEHNQRIEIMKKESEARTKACEAEKKQALANLKELHDAAIARLESLENGK